MYTSASASFLLLELFSYLITQVSAYVTSIYVEFTAVVTVVLKNNPSWTSSDVKVFSSVGFSDIPSMVPSKPTSPLFFIFLEYSSPSIAIVVVILFT